MTLTLEDSGEHAALDDLDDDSRDAELVAQLGPSPVYYLDRRDPARRAAGWLVAILASLIVWLLVGLAVLLALD